MLEAWTFIAATLLMVSGGAKIADPSPTQGALEAARLPSTTPLVVLLGLVEVIAGVSAVVVGGAYAIPMAVLYLGFAIFVVYALTGGLPIQSCGCFGRIDTPPSSLHVAYNLLSALAAGGVAASDAVPRMLLSEGISQAALYLAFVGVGTWISYLLLARLPQLRVPS